MGNPEAGGQIGFEYSDSTPLPPSMPKTEPSRKKFLPPEPKTYKTPEQARLAQIMKKLTGDENGVNPYDKR